MFDIKLIRDNPDAVRELLKNRRSPVDISQVLDLDARRRAAITEADALKSERNAVSKKIGELKRAGQDTAPIQEQMKAIGQEIAALDAETRELSRMRPSRSASSTAPRLRAVPMTPARKQSRTA